MRSLRGAGPFGGQQFRARPRGVRERAGAHRLAVDVHRAGAALREAAAEARAVQTEIVPQGVEQRHLRIVNVDRALLAVQDERDRLRHEVLLVLSPVKQQMLLHLKTDGTGSRSSRAARLLEALSTAWSLRLAARYSR